MKGEFGGIRWSPSRTDRFRSRFPPTQSGGQETPPEEISLQGRGPCAEGWKEVWVWARSLVVSMENWHQSHDQIQVREYDECYVRSRMREILGM